MEAKRKRKAPPRDAREVADDKVPTDAPWAAMVSEDVSTLSLIVRENLSEVTEVLKNCGSALEDAEEQMKTAIETKQASMQEEEEATRKEIAKEWQLLRNEVKKLEVEKETMKGVHAFQSRQVKLDVGGHRFTTSLTTLTSQPGSMLAAMFSGRHKLVKDEKGAYFIDRDGTHFRYILNFLRDGQVGEGCLPEGRSEQLEILRESQYYQLTTLTDHIKAMFMPVVTQREVDALKCGVNQYYYGGGYPNTDPNPNSFLVDGSNARSSTLNAISQGYRMDGKNLANLTFAKLHFNRESSFEGSYMRGADFSGCNFAMAVYFNDANLTDTNFEQCGGLLSGRVDFTGAKLDGAKFLPGVKEKLKT